MGYPGKALLKALKEVPSQSPPHLGLKIAGYEGYFLRPITTKHGQINPKDVTHLTEWRNLYPKSFLTEFNSTELQTSEWLCDKCHHDDSRISFMIENAHGDSVGYMGIAYIDWEKSYVEGDSIVSGCINPKGLMTAGLITLLRWAKGQLGLQNVGVRVLSDNPALLFYKKMGFHEVRRVPLKMVNIKEDIVQWIEDESLTNASRHLVHHKWIDSQNI